MKIGLVLSKTPAYSETFFTAKIKGLQDSGFRVLLYVQHKDPDFDLCEVKTSPKVYTKNPILQLLNTVRVCLWLLPYYKRIHRFWQLEKKSQRSSRQLFKNIYNNAHLLTSQLDWVHFGFATIALQSENVAKAIGAKMAVSFRGFDLDVYPLDHAGCYDLLWQRVDKIHSISKYLLEKGYSLGMTKETPFQVITPAIAMSSFETRPTRTNKVPQLLTIARLHWIKGLVDTLEALSILKKQGNSFNYKIIGSGPEYEHIVFCIHQLNLTDEVELLGTIEHAAIQRHLNETDIYLQYSFSEGFCNAVLEAQAAGCICVVSDGGGLTENIVASETGYVVPKRNPRQLAETLLKVIHLSDLETQRMTQNAQNRLKAKFRIDQQEQAFKEFYESDIG